MYAIRSYYGRFTRNKVGKNAHLIWSIYNASLIVNNSLFKENETANYIFSDEDMYDDQRDERTTVIQSSTFTENLISGIILNIDKTSSWSSRKDKVEFVNNIVCRITSYNVCYTKLLRQIYTQ